MSSIQKCRAFGNLLLDLAQICAWLLLLAIIPIIYWMGLLLLCGLVLTTFGITLFALLLILSAASIDCCCPLMVSYTKPIIAVIACIGTLIGALILYRKRKKCAESNEHMADDSCSSSFSFSACPICFEQPTEFAVLECNHKFCQDCIGRWYQKIKNCPMCRRDFTINADD